MKFATKPVLYHPPHLTHVAIYLGKLKIRIYCRYSADTEEYANKLHFCRL